MARAAVEALAGCGDIRLEALASGAELAARWSDHGGGSPVSGQGVGVPNLREIADEGAAAGRVAAGAVAPMGAPLSDGARIVARGVQEWLAYAYLKGYPTPWWLVSGMPLDELRSGVLAGVGADGVEGLSGESFAYDVADVVSGMLGD